MNIKRYSLIAAAAVLALSMSACSSPSSEDGGEDDGARSVANVVPGALGDQSFYDDAESGIAQLKSDGYTATTLQGDANNPAQWKANLQSVSTGQNDVVVIGSSTASDTITEVAPKFPDQHYIFYDGVIDAPNVASLTYKQNEGSFLAGVLAALATTQTEDFPLADGSKKIGLVGGMDIPVINDFAAGFRAGAEAVDPSVEVLVSYVGSFSDSAKGYDQAKAMFDQGADVVYQVAGGAGVGVLQAAADADKYAIGVDSNQNALQKGHILASMLKHVGASIVQAVEDDEAGTLAYGKTTEFGLANDGVGLTFDDNEGIVPDAVIQAIDDYKQKVVDGEIEVPSGF
ncbi:BMP family protein [Microbacterium sp. EST19A]|uniref:BMP family lipoprotein n=1 Tax=Microbacterium sp. EST19A TaxID=2862681 RepID=UPI001CBB12BA|nr:BMP family ABC transporter substrate-binding protein [Microbacterium sp. EST19A]